MRKFVEMKTVRNISDLNGLRNVYDQIESNVRTFGANVRNRGDCSKIVRLNGEIYIYAYVVPNICSPNTNQAMNIAVEKYEHLRDLQLADYAFGDKLSVNKRVDVLVGSVSFWLFVEDGIIIGNGNGPVAMKSKLCWVVSGPVEDMYSNNKSHF